MTLRVERQGALALLRLDKPRGNAIDEELTAELTRAAAGLEKDAGVHGVLLCSAHPRVFCPGLDLVSLVDRDRPAMRSFMLTFAGALWALFGLSKPLVAAVNGAAVAGGCLLALTADHRVLRRGAPIGLNEVKVGVPLPWSATVLLRFRVAPQALERVALLGRNFSDAEALSVGLAHETADEPGFEALCLERLAEFADKDRAAIAVTKRWLREPVLQEMRAHEHARLERFLDGWFSAPTRERLRRTVSELRTRA